MRWLNGMPLRWSLVSERLDGGERQCVGSREAAAAVVISKQAIGTRFNVETYLLDKNDIF